MKNQMSDPLFDAAIGIVNVSPPSALSLCLALSMIIFPRKTPPLTYIAPLRFIFILSGATANLRSWAICWVPVNRCSLLPHRYFLSCTDTVSVRFHYLTLTYSHSSSSFLLPPSNNGHHQCDTAWSHFGSVAHCGNGADHGSGIMASKPSLLTIPSMVSLSLNAPTGVLHWEPALLPTSENYSSSASIVIVGRVVSINCQHVQLFQEKPC